MRSSAQSFLTARDSFASHRSTDAPAGRLTEIPVTIAWGTRDHRLPHRTQSKRARAALPSARHISLVGCGHLPFHDDPARCADVVLAIESEVAR